VSESEDGEDNYSVRSELSEDEESSNSGSDDENEDTRRDREGAHSEGSNSSGCSSSVIEESDTDNRGQLYTEDLINSLTLPELRNLGAEKGIANAERKHGNTLKRLSMTKLFNEGGRFTRSKPSIRVVHFIFIMYSYYFNDLDLFYFIWVSKKT